MSSTISTFITILILPLLWLGCSKETVDPNYLGSIQGTVLNSQTGEPIISAEVTTNPGTDVVLTNENGQYSFEEVPTGNYSVTVKRDGFQTKTVRISVTEDRTTPADISLSKDDDDISTNNNIKAEVTFFETFNYGPRDSIYVNVEYKFTNISSNQRIGNYEVYFKIFTPGSVFYHEVPGDSLAVGEQSTGTFEKYIYQYEADSVRVSGIFAP